MTGRSFRREAGAVIAAFTVIFTFACSASAEGTFEPATTTDLVGKTFVSKELTRNDIPPGTRFRVTFGREQVWIELGSKKFGGRSFVATAGCNDLSGVFKIKNGKFRVPFILMTLVGCGPLNSVEDRFSWFLDEQTSAFFSDGVLELRRKGHRIRLDELKQPPDQPSLKGTHWKLLRTTGPRGKLSGPGPVGKVPRISFGGGYFRIKGPCLKASGPTAIGDGVAIFDMTRVEWGFCGRADRRLDSRQKLGYLTGLVEFEFGTSGNLIFHADEFELEFVKAAHG